MISVKSNVDEVLRGLDRFMDQAPFAIAVALTKTAVKLKDEIVAEQAKVFDRPTPYTQRGMFVRKATKQRLVAEVLLKDRLLSGTSRSRVETIGHQYSGGARRRKAIEYFATRAGLIGANEYLVPSTGARLDSYGNMSRGQVAQVMSQLKLGSDPASHATKSVRSKRNQRLAGLMFWSRGGHLQRGVWMRTSISVVPVLMAESNVKYSKRIDIQRIGDRVFAQHFKPALEQSWARALATRR